MMFTRRAGEPPVSPQEPPPDRGQAPAPENVQRPVCLFGTKAEKEARFGPPLDPRTLPPQLVSIGRQVHQDPGSTNQRGKVYEYEAFINPRRPHEKWIRWPGEARPQRVDSHSSDPKPEQLGWVPRNPGGPSQHGHPPGKDDEKIPMPQPTAEDVQLARALFGGNDARRDPPPRPAFDPVPW